MPDPLQKPKRQKPNAVEGTALVIVLSCLVLLATLAISLLNRVESDRSSSASYRGGTQTKNLADYAINVVMAQINTATADPALAWASQPGAIRTYSATGSNLVNIYKLYSSTNMVVNAFPAGDITALANWAASPALFTDLNAPIITKSGSSTNTNYPILDPGATNSVQGFAITNAPNATTDQPAPMPVNWLYVLQDGNLVAPSAGSGNTTTVTGATSSNPIIGRIAFWADDETCKININTAAGMPWSWATNNPGNGATPRFNSKNATGSTLFGSYWDIPVMGSLQDQNLVFCPPYAGEYQRFPGHPATVSLSSVFTNLNTNDIMAIAPRISYGSSGTNGSLWGKISPANSSAFNWDRIPSDGARLYANVDELLYATNRSTIGTNPISVTNIEQGRFFLTAASRAPDVTMFNTPRLVFWPINTSTSKQTPYDKLIAFEGTVGANTNIGSVNSYYFIRSDAYSSNTDYNANSRLLGYLRTLTETPVPGFGGSGILSKYSSGEPDQIRTEIFDYIRCINLQDTSLGTASGYTNNFYTTNFYSTNGLVVPSIGVNSSRGLGRMPFVTKVGMLFWFTYPGTNNVYKHITTGGSTNNYSSTNGEAICARMVLEGFMPGLGYPTTPNNKIVGYTNVVSGLTNGFKWGLDSSSNTATNIFGTNIANFPADNLGTTYAFLGGSLPIHATSATNGASNTSSINSISFIFTGGNLTTSSGTTYLYSGNVTTGDGVFIYGNNTVNATSAQYVGGTVTTNTNTGFYFFGGNISVNTYYRNSVVQTINNINFPDAVVALPWPTEVTTDHKVINTNGNFTTNEINRPWVVETSSAASRLTSTLTTYERAIIDTDVVRSVQIADGDYRRSACISTLNGATFFTNHPGYFTYTISSNATNSTNAAYMAHSFMYVGSAYAGASMLLNAPYSANSTMTNMSWNTVKTAVNRQQAAGGMITNTIGGTNIFQYGDFDNGYGVYPDGPYSGFSDEGATVSVTNGPIPYYTSKSATTNMISPGPGYFSPNRIVPSAGIMGSLPSGVIEGVPWRTLLFRPAALTINTHRGLNNPPDYLLLDLFNMPVVEPYAISEPLSTAGRVNMNYQILPFTWIKRSTAVQAALHTERLVAISSNYTEARRKDLDYPDIAWTAGQPQSTNRFALDLSTNTGTLAGFEARFNNNEIFRSAAEICSIPLVPYGAGASYSAMSNWWAGYTYTGENSKERPYARIYPKLTTKSNTYTVHYKVEVLKQSPNSTVGTWKEGTDKILSTYRGSTTIERYVNPRDPSIPDYASQNLPLNSANALPYKFRILADRHFNP